MNEQGYLLMMKMKQKRSIKKLLSVLKEFSFVFKKFLYQACDSSTNLGFSASLSFFTFLTFYIFKELQKNFNFIITLWGEGGGSIFVKKSRKTAIFVKQSKEKMLLWLKYIYITGKKLFSSKGHIESAIFIKRLQKKYYFCQKIVGKTAILVRNCKRNTFCQKITRKNNYFHQEIANKHNFHQDNTKKCNFRQDTAKNHQKIMK